MKSPNPDVEGSNRLICRLKNLSGIGQNINLAQARINAIT
jgi:hypothetical protein